MFKSSFYEIYDLTSPTKLLLKRTGVIGFELHQKMLCNLILVSISLSMKFY
jgi:hypothetical protein